MIYFHEFFVKYVHCLVVMELCNACCLEFRLVTRQAIYAVTPNIRGKPRRCTLTKSSDWFFGWPYWNVGSILLSFLSRYALWLIAQFFSLTPPMFSCFSSSVNDLKASAMTTSLVFMVKVFDIHRSAELQFLPKPPQIGTAYGGFDLVFGNCHTCLRSSLLFVLPAGSDAILSH